MNEPLTVDDTRVCLLGNGCAFRITIRDASGAVAFSGAVPLLPQDTSLTSGGVLKVPDGLTEQVGMTGFFYPTRAQFTPGAFTAPRPSPADPLLALDVDTGDLGLDPGVPVSVSTLDTSGMASVAGGASDTDARRLAVGETAQLPNGLGSLTLDGASRSASLAIHRNPSRRWMLVFAVLVLAGLLASLLVPRRRASTGRAS